jgi:hypothetical protein
MMRTVQVPDGYAVFIFRTRDEIAEQYETEYDTEHGATEG